MSLENEHGNSAAAASETTDVSRKKPKISYTRDFLLSLSELETCKRLPNDFDRSVLSQARGFEPASLLRSHDSLPLQGFHRNDHSSSPPTHGDSDSGRRIYGNQSWRPRHDAEHDGLLGRGSFPRQSGYAVGASAPKVKTNEHYQLNRTSEPYQPPRPFKVVPHSRTSTNDTFNDETFGSSECSSQDRAEEERKRRASFESMRKEQQKVLQEKQNLNAGKRQSDHFSDLSLEAREKGVSETSCDLDPAIPSVSNNDSRKSSFLSQSSKSRPLVPPGFRSTVLEKSSTTKTLISSPDKENPKLETEEIHLPVKGNILESGKHLEDTIGLGLKMGEATINSSLGSAFLNEKLGIGGHHTYKTSGIAEVHETVDGGEVFQLGTDKFTGNKIISNSGQGSSTSILDKLFGDTPTIKVGGSSVYIEESNRDDSISHGYVQSSKFDQRFCKDEKRPVNNLSSGRPNDLLSLVVGSEKTGSRVSDITSTEHIQPEQTCTGLECTKVFTSTIPPESKHLYDNYKHEAAPPVGAVLTCEDLEQSILSEYNKMSSQPPVPEWSISGQENVDAKEVDNHATHHLLSLLQKGPTIEETKPNAGPLEKYPASKMVGAPVPKNANFEDKHESGQSLTLETLFGSAFMKELQSAEAPVSIQRGVGSARTDVFENHGLTPALMRNDPSFFASDGTESNNVNHEQLPKSEKVQNWLHFDGSRADMDSELSKFRKQAIDGVEIQLPEEDSLIIVGDPSNCHIGTTTKQEPLPSDATFNIAEKLAALSSGFRGEQSMPVQGSQRFVHNPFDLFGPERQLNNLHIQDSAQMNHNRMTMIRPLDPHPAHINSQMRFAQHDNPYQESLPNMLHPFHQPDSRVTGFDIRPNLQMLPQMPMPGNFPPHLLHNFPRPSPVPPYKATNLMPDTGAVHGFAFSHQQPNIGGIGMPSPAPGANIHPEAFPRIVEMGLGAHSPQLGPYSSDHSQVLDMGTRYR